MTAQPSSNARVNIKCSKCGIVKNCIFKYLIYGCNKRLEYIDRYVCPTCFKALPAYRDACRLRSLKAKERIIAGASERSKKLWLDDEYRAKMRVNHYNLATSSEFKHKVAEALRKKHKDPEYSARIKLARKAYWDKNSYRTPRTMDATEFINVSSDIHDNKYDYSKINYVNSKTKVVIICPEHGEFTQRPGHHVHYANGCPQCINDVSKPQEEIADFICELGLNPVLNDRIQFDGLELDVYIPSHRCAIEYNGGFWHSYNVTETTQQRRKHSHKADLAHTAGINLIQILDDEWLKRKPIVKSMIRHRLGLSSQKIFARKCVVRSMSSQEAAIFFGENHIAGNRTAQRYYCLSLDRCIVSALSVSAVRGNYELIRYACLIDFAVVGGLSRLLSYAVADLHITTLCSYANRRYSQSAAGYIACGFKLIGNTRPGYMYWKNNRYFNRLKFQKHKLKSLPSYDPDKTEAEIMFASGYRRIWDAGHYKLVRNYEN